MKYILLILFFIVTSVQAQSAFDKAEAARMKDNWMEALNYYEKAAENGSAKAAHWVGTIYLEGFGVEKNSVYAAAFFSLAANGGVLGSMVNLANMHLSGNGVAKDCEKAQKWIVRFSKGPIPPAWRKEIEHCKSTFNKQI